MTAASAEPGAWSKGRWWVAVTLILVVQVGLIFGLSGREPTPRAAVTSPAITLFVRQDPEWTELQNPTLFALPSRHGFSDKVWLEVPAVNPPALEWPTTNQYLPRQTGRLGRALGDFVRAGIGQPLEVVRPVPPQLDPVGIYPVLNLAPTQSTLRIVGDLAGRLLFPVPLKPQPALDMILTNSVVQVEVAADGRVFSAGLLNSPATSYQADADHEALELARTARFQPLRATAAQRSNSPESGFTRGILVFQWLTVAPPGTNAPPGASP